MPKSYITHESKQRAKVAAWVYGQLKVKHITQQSLAEQIGISQPALSQKLRAQSFNYEDILHFVKVFEPDQNEKDMILGMRK